MSGAGRRAPCRPDSGRLSHRGLGVPQDDPAGLDSSPRKFSSSNKKRSGRSGESSRERTVAGLGNPPFPQREGAAISGEEKKGVIKAGVVANVLLQANWEWVSKVGPESLGLKGRWTSLTYQHTIQVLPVGLMQVFQQPARLIPPADGVCSLPSCRSDN